MEAVSAKVIGYRVLDVGKAADALGVPGVPELVGDGRDRVEGSSKLQRTLPALAAGKSMKYAPPILPALGSASIQRESKARAAKPPIDESKDENLLTMKSRASANENRAPSPPTGAKRSKKAHFFSPSIRGLAARYRRQEGRDSSIAANHRIEGRPGDPRLAERLVEGFSPTASRVERKHEALDAVGAPRPPGSRWPRRARARDDRPSP